MIVAVGVATAVATVSVLAPASAVAPTAVATQGEARLLVDVAALGGATVIAMLLLVALHVGLYGLRGCAVVYWLQQQQLVCNCAAVIAGRRIFGARVSRQHVSGAEAAVGIAHPSRPRHLRVRRGVRTYERDARCTVSRLSRQIVRLLLC